jgi:hypothetical protein
MTIGRGDSVLPSLPWRSRDKKSRLLKAGRAHEKGSQVGNFIMIIISLLLELFVILKLMLKSAKLHRSPIYNFFNLIK